MLSIVKLCDDILPGQKWKVFKMKQDGNCFYSALSFQLFGTQNEHGSVRLVIYKQNNIPKQKHLQAILYTNV